WIRGIVLQILIYTVIGLLVLLAGRQFGLPGAAGSVVLLASVLLSLQLPIARLIGGLRSNDCSSVVDRSREDANVGDDFDYSQQISNANALVRQWGWKPARVSFLSHEDVGFTGGIVGLPGRETIVLPAGLVRSQSDEQLAVVIARRCEAIRTGSRTRGWLVAIIWVLVGFCLSAQLPGAGVTSVAGLVMTWLGFTLWTFVGLLTLPSLSRQAAHAIDNQLLNRGIPREVFEQTLTDLDRRQDDEPKRSALVETIFHPVPSVSNRGDHNTTGAPIAWHVARVTLFASWACCGMLVRAVHCNVGRPEMWVFLPTD
ncbi:MAG: hypothetical protein AAF539_14560, partial [Planctomycetota bacterium]